MLRELGIRNFAIIRDIRIEFGNGFQALTGETGAGKSIIIDALGALLGSRLSADFVRTDERRAWIEAIFDVEQMVQRPDFQSALDEIGVEPDNGMLILSRDVTENGRSTSRINGRTVTLKAMGQIGQYLVDIHGQSEHLSLLRPALHLDMLDQYAGTWPLRRELSEIVRSYHKIVQRIENIREAERDRAQRVDLLRFQIDEISTATVTPDEEEELFRERQVLTNAEKLRTLAQRSYSLLEGDDMTAAEGTASALDQLREATEMLDELVRLDPATEQTVTQIREATFLLEESAPALRNYAEEISADPTRLEAVEDRLALLKELMRKYGPELQDVIRYGEEAATELDELESSEARIEDLREQADSLRAEIGTKATELSSRRQASARSLEEAVEQAIADLHMGGAIFRVDFGTINSRETVPVTESGANTERGFDMTGVDRVEFLIAPNAGEHPRPLARIASGGETARLMLALKSILSDVDSTPTLIFDEVDVGVGGRSGQAVGEKLWQLSDHHQVIVISHLPQIAAFARDHYRITKIESNGRTETRIDHLERTQRVDEVAAMLDGVPVTEASRENARSMMERVDSWIEQHAGAGR